MSTDNNLWMGDVQTWMDESFILKAFNFYKFFPKSIKLIHDKITKELKNFCFINFQTMKEANNCLLTLNGKFIPNTQIKFKLNWANYFSTFNKSVYVGNLSPDVDDIQLYQLFKEKYPSVHHASVIADNGVSKGFGFILFRGEEDYEKCLKEMNGILFHGNIIKVNEQKKNNHKNSYSNNFSCDDKEENENDEINDNNYNINLDMAYNNFDKRNINNNIMNNNLQYSMANNGLNDSQDLNTNSIIDFYNLNNSNNSIINGFQNVGGNNVPLKIINNRNNISVFNANCQQEESKYMNQLQLNNDNHNSNTSNIINNIIHINNINKIQNINYINDINKIYNQNQNANQINNNYIKQNLNNNNKNNTNKLELSNKQKIYYPNILNNKSINDINMNKNLIKNSLLYNINNITNAPDSTINIKKKNNININKTVIMNKPTSKINDTSNNKEKRVKTELEILKNYDENTFRKKIITKLDIMYRYYIEQHPYDINKLYLSNMFIYYCQNEKQLKYYSSIF